MADPLEVLGEVMRKILMGCLLAAPCAFGQSDSQWTVTNATLTYHMSHPMHQVDGTSHEVKGKGVCHAGQCDFLIAAPVKSFDSGDTNRDLHMIEATRGAQFPMVVVRTHFPESAISSPTIDADIEVEFAGQTAHYQHVQFQLMSQGNETRVTGTVPSTCADFKVERPSFLTVQIKNEIPVRIEMTWRKN
jgi:hypothetical protein